MASKRPAIPLLLLINAVWLQYVAAVGLAPELGVNESGLTETIIDQLNDSEQLNKRAWQQLQNSWGKRAADDANDLEEATSSSALFVTGHFQPLLITDGENTLDWRSFQRLANGQEPELDSGEQSEPQLIANEKRTWKNMNVAWGKRRQAQNWNKFRGSWGKREPQWNNLKGMWGKRDQWQKLHGGWGKRSAMN